MGGGGGVPDGHPDNAKNQQTSQGKFNGLEDGKNASEAVKDASTKQGGGASVANNQLQQIINNHGGNPAPHGQTVSGEKATSIPQTPTGNGNPGTLTSQAPSFTTQQISGGGGTSTSTSNNTSTTSNTTINNTTNINNNSNGSSNVSMNGYGGNAPSMPNIEAHPIGQLEP